VQCGVFHVNLCYPLSEIRLQDWIEVLRLKMLGIDSRSKRMQKRSSNEIVSGTNNAPKDNKTSCVFFQKPNRQNQKTLNDNVESAVTFQVQLYNAIVVK
jgi:hypothetical protein